LADSITFFTLFQVALRSLLLEASWNHEGQQNLGLAAAIDPALKRLYSGESLVAARKRALGFFNTNPITSGLAIGVLLKIESEMAKGETSEKDRNRIMNGISRTLASMGDALFWQAWLPLCCLAAVWGVLSFGAHWWIPLLLPLLFCALAYPVRFFGLYYGYREGANVIELLLQLKIQRLVQGLKRAVALLVGASTVILLAARAEVLERYSLGRLWQIIGLALLVVVFLRMLSKKTMLLTYWYPVFMVTIAVILMITLGASAK